MKRGVKYIIMDKIKKFYIFFFMIVDVCDYYWKEFVEVVYNNIVEK